MIKKTIVLAVLLMSSIAMSQNIKNNRLIFSIDEFGAIYMRGTNTGHLHIPSASTATTLFNEINNQEDKIVSCQSRYSVTSYGYRETRIASYTVYSIDECQHPHAK